MRMAATVDAVTPDEASRQMPFSAPVSERRHSGTCPVSLPQASPSRNPTLKRTGAVASHLKIKICPVLRFGLIPEGTRKDGREEESAAVLSAQHRE